MQPLQQVSNTFQAWTATAAKALTPTARPVSTSPEYTGTFKEQVNKALGREQVAYSTSSSSPVPQGTPNTPAAGQPLSVIDQFKNYLTGALSANPAIAQIGLPVAAALGGAGLTYLATRKKRTKRRTKGKRRVSKKAKKRIKKKKLKFGSPAFRKKYLGKKRRRKLRR
jgi:hypothetical protein